MSARSMNPARDPMPIGDRMSLLLKATEDGLRIGIAPLSHQFLCNHDVTLDEAYDLAELIADACRMYRHTPAHYALLAIAAEAGEDAAVTQ